MKFVTEVSVFLTACTHFCSQACCKVDARIQRMRKLHVCAHVLFADVLFRFWVTENRRRISVNQERHTAL